MHFSTMSLQKYKGYYRTVRDGKRVGITFTYNHVNGKMINEVETKVEILN